MSITKKIGRRASIHESGTNKKQVQSIKRSFYGLEDADEFFRTIWSTHYEKIQSLLIVVIYYVVGYLFYSHVEGWDGLICVYFQTVTLTTVGYGDYSPSTNGSRIFTMFYIFSGIAIVGRIIDKFAVSIQEYAERKAAERRKLCSRFRSQNSLQIKLGQNSINHIEEANDSFDEENTDASISSVNYVLDEDPTKWHYHRNKIITSIGSMFLCLIMGALFYQHNEDWDFVTALYFCVVTTTTVGYGDTSLQKESSKVFAVFYILLSCLIIALALGNLASVRMQMVNEAKRVELMSRKLDFNFIRELDNGENDLGIDKTSFLVAMLVQLELVDKEKDVDPWLEKFDALDKNCRGFIDFDEAIEDLEKEEEERQKQLHLNSESKDMHRGYLDILGNSSSFLNMFDTSHLADDEYGEHANNTNDNKSAHENNEIVYVNPMTAQVN